MKSELRHYFFKELPAFVLMLTGTGTDLPAIASIPVLTGSSIHQAPNTETYGTYLYIDTAGRIRKLVFWIRSRPQSKLLNACEVKTFCRFSASIETLSSLN
jgi:hypothetical protein